MDAFSELKAAADDPGLNPFPGYNISGLGLGFLNLTSHLRQSNVIGFCIQLGNS